MEESKKNQYGLVNVEIPNCVDNAITNITDKPTKAIGDSISDIWFLVFGGIGQVAEKKRMRYAVELEKYNKELHSKIEEIPVEQKISPDIQIIAPTLEASKYCVEKQELREMFVNLIASSMDSSKDELVHPIFTDIIKKLSSTDALLFKSIAHKNFNDNCVIYKASIKHIVFSLAILEQVGLVSSQNVASENKDENSFKNSIVKNDIRLYDSYIKNLVISDFIFESIYDNLSALLIQYMKKKNLSGDFFPIHKSVSKFFEETISLTRLGEQFKQVCF